MICGCEIMMDRSSFGDITAADGELASLAEPETAPSVLQRHCSVSEAEMTKRWPVLTV